MWIFDPFLYRAKPSTNLLKTLKMGRPTKYRPEYARQAKKLGFFNPTDEQLAEFFDVSIDAIRNWKKDHPEFGKVIREAKERADRRVEKSLYKRAVGFTRRSVHFSTHKGEVIQTPYDEYFPPDVKAQFFWLSNREREKWKEQQDARNQNGPLVAIVNDVDLAISLGIAPGSHAPVLTAATLAPVAAPPAQEISALPSSKPVPAATTPKDTGKGVMALIEDIDDG